MPSRGNRAPPKMVPTMVAPMPQAPWIRPIVAALKPVIVRKGIAMALSKPSGQR